MAKRKIINIDENKCNGCGRCAEACHEGAIGMVNGRAHLLREDYCDGLGDCLPSCPTGAISFVEREAAAYDEAAVRASMAGTKATPPAGGCPGRASVTIERNDHAGAARKPESRLGQWPVQLRLVPVNAPYFSGADLLIAADCTAFAYGGFHERFIKGRITLIGCPKLDEGDYSDKLTSIIKENDIRSVTVARMEVPCCGGIASAAARALYNSGKALPLNIVTISTDGKIVEERS